MRDLQQRLEAALGDRVTRVSPIGSGAAGSVSLVETATGPRFVAKQSESFEGEGLAIEGRMLRVLSELSPLPVPRVVLAEADLLVMEHRPGRSTFDEGAERHAAELLAGLHSVQSDDGQYGLGFDGLIGPLHQPNAWSGSWVEFWRDRRIGYMAEHAAKVGQIDSMLARRLERLCGRLEELIPDRPRASLIHGDVWSGNVLAEKGRVTAFLDPSPYYAHHEVELAFITMFSTFGSAFFARYGKIGATVEPAFWSTRRHVYMVYPLMVHVRLFGGGYVGQVSSTLDMLGF